MLPSGVDERCKWLDIGCRPVADPVVVATSAEEHIALSRDDPADELEELRAVVEEPVARLLAMPSRERNSKGNVSIHSITSWMGYLLARTPDLIENGPPAFVDPRCA